MWKVFGWFILSLIKELDLDHIFAHSNGQVYDRLAQIIWKEPQLHKDTIMMGGLHQLSLRYKTIIKRHSIKGYQKWVIDVETVAFGSTGASVKGRHYYHNIRINKEIFSAWVQFRAENITNDYQDLTHEPKRKKKKWSYQGGKHHHLKCHRQPEFPNFMLKYIRTANWYRMKNDNLIPKRHIISNCTSFFSSW